jgi:hypothetical protein
MVYGESMKYYELYKEIRPMSTIVWTQSLVWMKGIVVPHGEKEPSGI